MGIKFENRAHSASNFEPMSAKLYLDTVDARLARALAAIGTLGVI